MTTCRLVSLSVLSIILFSTALTTTLAKGIGIANLRCEYHSFPMAIDTPAPRLSWEIESDIRGQKQTAYRILAASSAANLRKNVGDLWDSGKIAGNQTNQIAYSGNPLVSRQQCFWKVKVWDKDGKESAWSKTSSWRMGLLNPEDWKAKWIGVANYTANTMPCIRKSFDINKRVKQATIYITAAGLFELYINGKRIGNDYFAPGWTEYNKRIYYFTYDVTDSIENNGENVIGVMLADGWYGLHHNGRKKLALLSQLNIEYTDGSSEIIGTDGTWKTSLNGPVLMSDIYNGESYDARREMAGWNLPGYNSFAWNYASTEFAKPVNLWVDVTSKLRNSVRNNSLTVVASNELGGDPAFGVEKALSVKYRLGEEEFVIVAAENQILQIDGNGKQLEIIEARYGSSRSNGSFATAKLQAYPGSPVRKIQEIKPIGITEPKPGVFVYDMGQNFSGWVRLQVKGQAGDKVVLRFVEMLNPDGTVYTTNLRSAKCTDTYILKGNSKEVWEPRFTFHGFRYVEVTGYPGKPEMDAITGVVLHSDATPASSFECSNPMLNQLYHNIVWGQKSNYLEVPTDCPQRDERLGWSGDAQVFIGTATYNMDIAPFFTSWMNTFNDSQDEAGGYPNVSPKHYGVSPAWGDAGVICPWVLYQRYGDTRIITDHWDGMTKWITYLTERSDNYLRPDEGFGDWLNIGAEMPRDVISTAYYGYVVNLMSKMANIIGKPEQAAEYSTLFTNIKSAFNRAYVDEKGHIKGDTQTTYLMALGFDLLRESRRQQAADRLIELIKDRNNHISIGFLGVNLLLPVLTDIGRQDLSYILLQNEDYPSWGYPIKHGATTIWERWDGWTEDKGFQNPGMNSFNHYAYGSCGEWMFSAMAGIKSEKPGFEKVTIRPVIGGNIKYTKAVYDSIRGKIAVYWKQTGDVLSMDVTIPANTVADIYVPAKSAENVYESGKPATAANGLAYLRMEGGYAVFEAGSGVYRFKVKL